MEISPETIPDVARQPRVMEQAVAAGKALQERLHHGHDRARVTQRMQALMLQRFEAAVWEAAKA